MVVARRRRVTPTITDEEQSNIYSSLHTNKVANMSPQQTTTEGGRSSTISVYNPDNDNNDLQSRPPLSPSPTKSSIIPSRKSTTTNCEDNSSFNMSSNTSVEDNDCNESLNSMSLADLHTTTNTPINRSSSSTQYDNNTINSNSDLSISPIKETSNNMVRKTTSSIDDSYNKSCGTEHQINVARTIAKDVILSSPSHTGHTSSSTSSSKQDVVIRLNKTINSDISYNNKSSKQSQNNNNPLSNPPNHFKCPISNALLQDPVIDSEGNTYERTNILKW